MTHAMRSEDLDTRPRCVRCYLPVWDGFVPVDDLHRSSTLGGANLVMGLRLRVVREAFMETMPARWLGTLAIWIGRALASLRRLAG